MIFKNKKIRIIIALAIIGNKYMTYIANLREK